jgi:hypothetical protein
MDTAAALVERLRARRAIGRALDGSRLLAPGVTCEPDVGDPSTDAVRADGRRGERVEPTRDAVGAADRVVLLALHRDDDVPSWLVADARHLSDARGSVGGGGPTVTVL